VYNRYEVNRRAEPVPLIRFFTMARVVKNTARTRRAGSRISSKHQVTIPIEAFATAGLREGDVVRIEATGPGRVVLTRQDDLLDQFSGALRGGDQGLRQTIDDLRDEWA
jgi:bifunctional DNA-binding transcriptional regulator/antitoxin component of YhaV-PrlF toxin-antitoxin module